MKRIIATLAIALALASCGPANVDTTATTQGQGTTTIAPVDLTQLVDSQVVANIVNSFLQKYKAPFPSDSCPWLRTQLATYFANAVSAGVIVNYGVICDTVNATDTTKVVVDIYLQDAAGIHAFVRSIP
jgi:hypothetical protein